MTRATKVVLGLVLVTGVFMALIVWLDRRSQVEYTVTFKDGQNLAVGAPVRLDGREVGSVAAIRKGREGPQSVEVLVRLHAGEREALHAPPNSTARIRRGVPIVGTPWVEVFNRGEAGGGMTRGSTVAGLESWGEELTWTGRNRVARAWQRAVSAGRGQIEQLQLWLESQDAQAIRARVVDFVGDFEEAAARQAEGAQEKAAELARRARELGAELRNSPQARSAARDLDATLSRLLEESKDLSEEGRRKLEEVLEELRRASSAAGPGAGS